MTWLVATLGGAVGAVARYGATGWVQDRVGAAFPWGTAVVNVVGAFLLGMSVGLDGLGGALVAGFFGGFTTFSTWMVESFGLVESGGAGWRRAAVNVLGMLAAGVTAAAAGMLWAGGIGA